MAIVSGKTTSEAAVGFSNLPVPRQIGLLVGLAASIAIGVAVVLWANEPNYQPLYSNLNSRDAGEVVDVLDQSGIQFKVDKNTGAILVASDQVQSARMKLAAQGLPKNSGSGFNFLAEKPGLGSSKFAETARHRYALEKELASTISNFSHISKAKVHLAIPKHSVFMREKRQPSASVFIDLYSGYHLEASEVASIVHLVASSVPGLSSSNVTVVDENGRLLTDGNSTAKLVLANRLLNFRHQVENSYVKKIQGILIPLLGSGSVKAQVSAKINLTSSEQTQERYNPDQSAVRSEQKLEENRINNTQGEGGIPGALSNQPPAATKSDKKSEKDAPKQETSNKRQHIVKNYELDKTISHTAVQAGKIERLTVAVVVDNLRSYDAKTKEMTSTPLKKEEIDQITLLVKNAIGFDEKRGDSVNVINRPFAQPAPFEKLPEMSFWQQAWFVKLIKQVLGGTFVLFLVFGVLLPILRNLANRPVVGTLGPADGHPEGLAGNIGHSSNVSGQQSPKPLQTYEDRMQVVQDMASKDPKRVAQVVKTWVDGN